MYGRHQRRLHVCNQGDAGGPELRVFGRTGDLFGELGTESAVDGRGVHPDLLEYAAAHQTHPPAAAGGAAVVRSVPNLVVEAAGGSVGMLLGRRELVLQLFEGGADLVPQLLKPGFGAPLPLAPGGAGICIRGCT